jgi:hypothetical protein
MKNLFTSLFLVFIFMLTNQRAYAQWDLLSDLFGQHDPTVYNQYFGNLDAFDSTWTNPDLNNLLLDDLYAGLNDSSIGIPLDSTYLNALGEGLNLLNGSLPGFGLPGVDNDTLLGEFGRLDSLFNLNFDSLGGLFGAYQDSLHFDPGWTGIQVLGLDTLLDQQFNVLQDTFGMVADTTLPKSPGDLAKIIGKLFDQVAFPDLELAFGVQSGNFKYWEDRYSSAASVVRVGSVPRFDREAAPTCRGDAPRFPVEARWHLEASWVKGRVPTTVVDPEYIPDNDEEKMNPLLFSGDFAMMLTPRIGAWGNTSFRLITSLGMEFGTYAPSHKEYDMRYTAGNQGFATGYGPQAGVGFSMTTGSLTVYSINTITHGDVVRCAMPYRFDSQKFEVGMRFGNIVNVRYSTGKTSWQEFDNRLADVKHQFTIGIILQSLHH